MTLSKITTKAALQDYLHAAMQLEHATIPPYLTALYSLHPGTNSDAFHVIRVVAVEEMLHLTLAANLLNAVGGEPDMTSEGFVPRYPVYLPDGEADFQVSLEAFSPTAIGTFLKIERPAQAPSEATRVLRRPKPTAAIPAVDPEGDDGLHFWSIGEFYAEIARGIQQLHDEGVDLFTGDPSRQVTPELYYSGGGEVIPVKDLASALAAIELISEQGEGLTGSIYDEEGELSHYFRFQQLTLGRYYQPGDVANAPTGPALEVDWDAVYPILTNASLADFPAGSQVRAAAEAFNTGYAEFLALVNQAFTGQPDLLIPAVGGMFALRDQVGRLVRNPIPGRPGVHAAPTFEMPRVAR
jgi:hypothetical protein